MQFQSSFFQKRTPNQISSYIKKVIEDVFSILLNFCIEAFLRK